MMHSSIGRCVFVMLIMSVSHPAFTQKSIRHSNQFWTQYYNQVKLNERFVLMTDGGFRWSDGERLLYIARTGLSYQLKNKLRIATGITSTGAYNASGLYKFELRPYQELFTSTGNNRILVQHRLRVEERYFRNVVNGDILSGHDFNFRFRYQVSATIPLIKLSNRNLDQQLLLNVSDEIFVNAGEQIVYNFLDKNRLVIGPALQLRKNLNVGLAYNFQFSQLNAPASYASDNVIWLTVRHQLDVSNKQ